MQSKFSLPNPEWNSICSWFLWKEKYISTNVYKSTMRNGWSSIKVMHIHVFGVHKFRRYSIIANILSSSHWHYVTRFSIQIPLSFNHLLISCINMLWLNWSPGLVRVIFTELSWFNVRSRRRTVLSECIWLLAL